MGIYTLNKYQQKRKAKNQEFKTASQELRKNNCKWKLRNV